ncbi:hypothetical protein JHK87_004639 [Glycine soja]|nr:hypothetical protein JHK87_004639 [Glycine soja]
MGRAKSFISKDNSRSLSKTLDVKGIKPISSFLDKSQMVKSSMFNSKRVYNDPSIHHSLEKEVMQSLPNSASHASELTNIEQKKDSISGEWPDAIEVWKATHMISNGTWCIPKGEEIMDWLLAQLVNSPNALHKLLSEIPLCV